MTLKQETTGAELYYSRYKAAAGGHQGMADDPATVIAKTVMFVCL